MTAVRAATSHRPDWLLDDLARIEELLLETASASRHSLVSESSTHLLKAGGKRIRPSIVLIAARAGTPTASSDLAAAAVELVHLATLYHDDVIDETETRRGAPTAHSKWGTDVAVLAGDYLFARACELGAEAGGEVPKILSRALAGVCEGQIAEMETVGRPRKLDEYTDTLKLKTASLFNAACELGSATSDVNPATRAALASYGENLGIAFQIVDDLLDLVGDPEVTGKRLGTDLREGIYTLPVILGLERSSDLAPLLETDPAFEDVLAILQSSGALEDSRQRARGYLDTARGALAGLPDEPWRAALESIADDAGAGVI
ncbi:MAG TPA: polyprenyl synthetase family protein [Actinomycetota bacterium]|nr:polyprenyl synthetase family protein [Actinomycetota bacterium]